VQYTERSGIEPRLTSLDVYRPTSGSDLPVVIYVHGGGWTGGDKTEIGVKPAYFTARGFVFVSVNYRLIPHAWPAEQADDVAEAVAWVREHSAAYGGDGRRLFLLGHSAGAHLSALVASNPAHLRRAGLEPRALRGVVLLDSGAYDVEQLMRSPDGQAEVYRPAFAGNPAAWPTVSPCANVAAGKGIPPHLLLLATAEGQRRPAAESLVKVLRSAGVYAHLADASAFRDHHTITEDLGKPGDPPTAVVQVFLETLLRGGPTGLGGEEVVRPTS
jgi:acetyl esterase/lipase